MSDINIFKLENVFIVKKNKGSDFFFTTNDSFSIPTFNFFSIIKFMLFRNLINPKSLEGILDEYYNSTNN